MNLKRKLLSLLCIAVTLYIGGIYVILDRFLLSSFNQLELIEAKKDLSRALSALNEEISHLMLLNKDWTNWDKTYSFANSQQQDYIESYLGENSFRDSNLNGMHFFNNENLYLWGKQLDFHNEYATIVEQDLLENLMAITQQVNQTGEPVSDIIITKATQLIATAAPILSSEGKGPARGVVILTRAISQELVDRLIDTTRIEIQLWSVNELTVVNNSYPFYRELLLGAEKVIAHAQSNQLTLYTLIKDSRSSPALMLAVANQRDIYDKGIYAMWFTFWTILFSAPAALFSMLILVKIVRQHHKQVLH